MIVNHVLISCKLNISDKCIFVPSGFKFWSFKKRLINLIPRVRKKIGPYY